MDTPPSSPPPADPSGRASGPHADASRIAILGLGQMGLVCATCLSDAPAASSARPVPEHTSIEAAVRMWGHAAGEATSLSQTRRSDRLPEIVLADDIRVCLTAEEALDGADVIVSAIPVQAMRQAWTAIREHVPPSAAVLSVAKGIETDTLLRPTQIITDVLHDDPDTRPRPVGTLSGPTIATELARGLPATMIAASDDPAFNTAMQTLFSTSWLRVYTHDDLLGVELAGATKNVIAIAAGIIDGLNAGYNAKSALLARGLAEISRLGAAMGAKPDTFFGISGVGDLATTCFSPEGRNRTCGEALGRGVTLQEHLASVRSVVEGVETTRGVVELARKYRVEMPITEAVHDVLFEKLDPLDAISRLMSRELRDERVQ